MAIYHVVVGGNGTVWTSLEIHEGKRRAFTVSRAAEVGKDLQTTVASLAELAGNVRKLSGSERVAQVKRGGEIS